MSESKALSLKFEPDDYLCTWHLPGKDGSTIDLAGSLEVRPNRPPRGVVYGEMPIEYDKTQSGGISAGFPQRVQADVVTATLANGGAVTLLDAQIAYSFPSQGRVSGSAAILSREGSLWGAAGFGPRPSKQQQPKNAPRYGELTLQVSGLDAVLGTAPIGEGTFPGPNAGSRTWSATYDAGSTLTWNDDRAKLKVGYDGRARTGNAFEFRLTFSPTATVELNEAISFRAVIDNWVQPFRRVVSIATGRPETLTYLSVCESKGDDSQQRPQGQVFGIGIEQSPYESDLEQVRDTQSALRCSGDGVSLLTLVSNWQALTASRHPLIETYGAMLHVPDQHPRSRFLLLIQAIEGMHGFATKQTHDAQDAAYVIKRKEFLDRVLPLLEQPADKKLLKARLSKHLPSSLDEALTATISGLPIDLLPAIGETEVIATSLQSDDGPDSVQAALRLLRNDLAHGNRGYEPRLLDEVVEPLERVVRAHALRLLGCPDGVLERVLGDDA